MKYKIYITSGGYYEVASFEEIPEDANYEIIENEINQNLQNIVASIEQEYEMKIDELLRVHIQKHIIEGTEIPQNILDERNILRNECNDKIAALGIDVSAYRQSNRQIINLI
ncbi:hypothetical protein LZZ90_08310 [Flavobacterium sp. SM15]|uniref:hypothetical protein n=1 Tax=Flavobacterium sp. SM15 TaxID=2908005 RepID=UPI001EDB32DA|nr:hypothetical protein [Flavobacterium sp. SM15]MCG2611509.1 hypothetical protein [Flavobacterium sp. SM15]